MTEALIAGGAASAIGFVALALLAYSERNLPSRVMKRSMRRADKLAAIKARAIYRCRLAAARKGAN